MHVETGVRLDTLSTLGVPSSADYFCRVTSDSDWLEALDYATNHDLPLTILGGGSNVILGDQIRGIVVHPVGDDIELIEQTGKSVLIEVLAGAHWDWLVRYCNQRGWYGLENLVSIPGSCGAAPVQNVGAYGVEIAEFIDSVRVLDLHTSMFAHIQGQDCGFTYRDSHFKGPWRDRYAIVSIRLRLSKVPMVNTNYAALANALVATGLHEPSPLDVLNTVAAIRAAKLPDVHLMPNSGSFFKNPIVSISQAQSLKAQYPDLPLYDVDAQNSKLSAAYLIETAGLKGYCGDGCGISQQHALVLVNEGHASGAACVELAQHVINTVQAKFGVTLHIEPVVIGL